jgi:C4-type Zn-finger protein
MHHPRRLIVRCCPACGSFDVRRSHRRSLLEVVFLPLFLMRAFRCEDCGYRHYNFVWARALPGASGAPPDEDEALARK